MILKQYIKISEICFKFQKDDYEAVIGEIDEKWVRICLKNGDEFMTTKIKVLKFLIELNIRATINDDIIEWLGILNQSDPNNFATAWMPMYYKAEKNDKVAKEDIETVFDEMMNGFIKDDANSEIKKND
jgi:hypothetical protein